MARGAFTFIVMLICTTVFGLSYIIVKPIWDILMYQCLSLVPSHSAIYNVFQLFFEYLPLVFFGCGLIIWVIVQSMSSN
jgi:hypothetical protein